LIGKRIRSVDQTIRPEHRWGKKRKRAPIWIMAPYAPIGTFFVPPMDQTDQTYSFIYIPLVAYAQDVDYFYIVLLLQICMFEHIDLTQKVKS
jgi:hypothetical protein